MLWSWKANTYEQRHRVSYNNRFEKYFTLGVCCGPERPIHMNRDRESDTITDLKKYFTLGGCCGPERPMNMNRDRESATITDLKNISLWEGVMVLKGQFIWTERARYNNRFEKNISIWEDVVVLKGQFIWTERARYNNRFEKNISIWEDVVVLKG